MADNETTGASKAVATHKVTHSGDADQNVQLMDLVAVSGAEGSKTVTEIVDSLGGVRVNLRDTSGNALTPSADVVEDAAAAANPSGPQIMLRRRDTLTDAEVSADSDHVAANGTKRGELSVFFGGTRKVDATLTRPADTTAYTADDEASSSTSAPTILTFSGCARYAGGGGTILAALMRDSAYSATEGSFELWLFDTTHTPDNDNAAFTPTDGEVDNVVAVIPFIFKRNGDKTAGATGNMLYESTGGPWPFVTSGSADLFGRVVARGAYTPISAETFRFRLFISPD